MFQLIKLLSIIQALHIRSAPLRKVLLPKQNQSHFILIALFHHSTEGVCSVAVECKCRWTDGTIATARVEKTEVMLKSA